MVNMYESIDIRKWLNPVISKVTENLGEEFNDARYDLTTPDQSFFISSMFFMDITAKSEKMSVKVVVKRPPMKESIRNIIKAEEQFHNEILFYSRIAKDHENLPRCIYMDECPPIDSVIVLENINRREYELCKWRYNVPFEYAVAAIRDIARFHTKGYVMKDRHRDEFFDFVWNLREARYDLNPENRMKILINASMIDQGYRLSSRSRLRCRFLPKGVREISKRIPNCGTRVHRTRRTSRYVMPWRFHVE